MAFAVVAMCLLAVQSCRVASKHEIALRFFGPASLGIMVVALGAQIVFAGRSTGLEALIGVLAIGTAAIASVTDLQSGYIFDAVTVPALGATFALAGVNGTLAGSLAGAAIVGACFAALHLATRGRGIGLADAKLGACIGAAVGVQQGVAVMESAFVLGGVYAAVLLTMRRARRGTEIRFAPYLAIALTAALICR
jgi:leader peptidase (prepilin peptidase)/N-methyltransferase